ncbi:unnamed protein product [Parnassius apollo]|uniref:(apollo) hypothetical protein n=1 Tax=Parnassius apollo TaxID=110799 RepID=A0A8S3XI98_PARAO|nr:unnamed protein product [Parnassius apollo]
MQTNALAMDESCDVTDTAQLIIFVRYLDKTGETFVEEILALLSLLGRTRGEDMIKPVMDYFEKDELDLKKLLSVTTDGKGKLICELMSDVKSFSRKLDLFINDLGNECLHFPNLNKIISSDNETDVGRFKTFITDLKSEFQKRFADFKKIENVVEILSSIYFLHPDGEWSNEAAIVFGSDKATLQMEMIDFQENTVLKHKQSEVSSEEF